jgi:hypothetical protein
LILQGLFSPARYQALRIPEDASDIFRALPDDAQEHHDTTDRTIAESNNFIVLDKFTEWEPVTATRVNRS